MRCPGCSQQTLALRDRVLESVGVRISCRGCGVALRVSPWWRVVMVVFGASILVVSAVVALDFGTVVPLLIGLVVAFSVGPLAPLGVHRRHPMTARARARRASTATGRVFGDDPMRTIGRP